MTEEQIKELLELIDTYKKADIFTTISCLIALISVIVLIVLMHYYEKKRKKAITEYKATLNEEQLKAIKKYKEISK